MAVVCACLALAALSLSLPYSLSSEEWTWLIWGREVRHLALDTTGGTAWKPLPVLLTPLISLAGQAAPGLWLVLVRATGLLGAFLTYRVGSRLAGPVAGLVGVLGLLLIPNSRAEWPIYFENASYEPLLLALIMGAILRHLDGHRTQALALGCLAALARPEVWVVVVAYGFFVWRGEPRRWPIVVAMVAAVPVLWLGGALLNAGHPLAGARLGAERTPEAVAGSPIDRALTALGIAAGMVIVPVWALAAAAAAPGLSRLRDDPKARVTVALGAGALVWIAALAALGVAGVAIRERYMFGPAVAITAIAGVGLVKSVRAVRGPRLGVVVGLAIAALLVAFAVPRVRALPAAFAPRGIDNERAVGMLERAWVHRRCGARMTIIGTGGPNAARVAWRLGLPRHVVQLVRKPTSGVPPGVVAVRAKKREPISPASLFRPLDFRLVRKAGRWSVYEVGCGSQAKRRADAQAPGSGS